MIAHFNRITCDSCGFQVEYQNQSAPYGWTAVAVNLHAPNPSFDHANWRHFTICTTCASVLMAGTTVRLADMSGFATPEEES